jgi:dehydrogenase/reductase SDR family member 4
MNHNISKFLLKGKIALITGASRGIGAEIAATYSNAGARIVICGRNKKRIEEAAEKIRDAGGDVLTVVANVSASEDRERLVKAAVDWGGRVDILVNNAATNSNFGPAIDLTESVWNKVIDVNLKAPFNLSQLVYHAGMKDNGGVVINISSVGGFEVVPGSLLYNVSKAALNHLTRCLACEWGHNGIRVNAIAPGLIKTQFSKYLWENLISEQIIKKNPIPRIGEPADIAAAALFLATDASSFVTGHILIVDGGELIRPQGAIGEIGNCFFAKRSQNEMGEG